MSNLTTRETIALHFAAAAYGHGCVILNDRIKKGEIKAEGPEVERAIESIPAAAFVMADQFIAQLSKEQD